MSEKTKHIAKVLHIVAGELTEGAARGALWLHRGLIRLGITSKILTNSTTTLGDPDVISVAQGKKEKIKSRMRQQLQQVPTWIYRNREKVVFSTGLIGYDFTRSSAYQWADIVHLHWIGAGFVDIRHLSKIEKPLVWTMRDMWPMTGGCHYSMECTKYICGCKKCPQLRSRWKHDLSWVVSMRKKKYFSKKMKIVGISEWLSRCARRSHIFQDFDIRTIHNNVDCEEFFPISKSIARDLLALPHNKRIILIGAQYMEPWKGFDKFIEAVKGLDREKYFLLFFGRTGGWSIDRLGFDFKSLGFLHDAISLRIAYSAADVFVAPSLMEAFGKTLGESMACGTPVVCFDATGMKDIVDHKRNGYKAGAFDPSDMREGIQWILADEMRRLSLAGNAVDKIRRCFDKEVIAKRYKVLYEEMTDTLNPVN